MYPNTEKKVKAVQYFLIGLIMISLLSLVFIKPVEASYFPSDTTTEHFEFTANQTGATLFASSTKTFLQFEFGADPTKNTQLWIYCGSATEGNEIFETHGQGLISMPYQYICKKEVLYTLTAYGGSGAHIISSFVNRDISNTNDPLKPISTGGFTYGEIFTIFLLLMLFTMQFFSILQRWIFGVRIENTVRFKYDKDA